jgi:hypothetical protein
MIGSPASIPSLCLWRGPTKRLPEAANRAVREYLAMLDDVAFGAATPVVPKFISHADPASRWTGANGGLAFFAYCTNYLIDLKHAVIVDVEPRGQITVGAHT